MNLIIQILSLLFEVLLLLKVAEILLHLIPVLMRPRHQAPELMAVEWPITKCLRRFRIDGVFRWPILVIGLSVLLSFSGQYCWLYWTGIVLLSLAIFCELLQALFTRMTFGYKDILFRVQSVKFKSLQDLKNFDPAYAMRDFIVFGSTLVFVSMIGWAGCYIALQNGCAELMLKEPCFNAAFESVFDAFYFSVVTFATIGYGDNFPKSLPAKILVVGEIMTSMASLGLLVLAFSMTAQPQDEK